MLYINSLSSKISKYSACINRAFSRVLASGYFVLGPEVNRFERLFAEYLGSEYCIGLANGTDAIELALKAMGVRPGSLVATVANAGMYTSTALLAIGAKPCFMDVDLDTRNVTLAEVVRVISQGVQTVVVTHLYGLACPDIIQIAEYCRSKGITLLEDCAQAHGARIGDLYVGTWGDAASFSFYPTKNLGALGDGGAVVTNNSRIAAKVCQLRQYGWVAKYHVEIAGARNSRLDEMQAAILSEFLPYLDVDNARRREIAACYSTQITHPSIILPPVGHFEYVAHLYVVRSASRDALREHLYLADIGSDVHYPVPDYQQMVFGDHFMGLLLPNTKCLAAEVLTLPCYPEMTDGQVISVIDAVNGWLV